AAIETLALNGGFMGLLAIVELGTAAMVLGAGAGNLALVVLFCGWIAIAGLFAWRYWSQRNEWTRIRLRMTNELVEKMVGYRTRLAQQAREQWHVDEDRMLGRYLDSSRVMDRSTIWLTGLIPRGWLLLGLVGLTSTFASQSGSIESVAVNLGGILLGYQAFGRFAASLSQIAGAVIVWQQIAPLLKAAGLRPAQGYSLALRNHQATTEAEPDKVVDAQDISFRYAERDEAVLQGCTLEIREGERLILEGASGGGKSTLASLLAGLRFPNSGLLLARGLDYQTRGSAGWRRCITAAPQFNENHVLTGSLAFNLLMGRRWPPEQADLDEAERVCHELGLGDVLERMPSGLMQVVGETGWQLSHGERSRVYLARALLQGSDLVILDESFASLDPESLRLALDCALRRARTLLVIAHA
ncbi:MAG TPA: ATP-binding cassette domain-containing protein, partial [Blastocatellia bacterium]|nr:ATP-binding cassette domain-containing protein [Blastocatellia bacterium]